MTTWNKNSEVYQKWLDIHESDIDTLKDMLCLRQFGYRVSHCKILWIPKKSVSYPIVVIPTVTRSEIEECALPLLFGKHKKYFLEDWIEYKDIRDGAKLEYHVESLCCLLQ
jgi:hypothetical protein